MTVRQARAIIAKLERHKAKIAAERDAMRALMSEYEDFLESTERAHEYIESAVDALSELV